MKVSLPARWSVTIIVFMALAGCGGGSGSGRDLDSSERLLQEATASLNAMLRRQADPTSQNLQNLAAKYSQAYTADRFNPQAAFGVGVSAVAHRARIVADMMPPEIAAGALQNPLLGGARLVTPWGLSAPTKASALETLRLAVNAPLALSRLSPPPQYDQLRTALLNLDGALEDSIVALQLPANTVGFSYVIADYHPGVPANATLTVDQADVQSILAGMHTLRAIVAMTLAYDFNYGSFDFSQTIESRFGAQLANGTPLAPANYLPPAPFGLLTNEGRAQMQAAQGYLSQGADVANAAANTLQARQNQTGHLIDSTGVNFTEVRAGIALFKNALTQPVTLGNDPAITVNLSAWFTNPPADLRSILPTYSTNASGAFTTPSSYPDPTLGGLLVNPSGDLFAAEVSAEEPVAALAAQAFTPAL